MNGPMKCQCCNTESTHRKITEVFSECSHCGVFRNDTNPDPAKLYCTPINTDWNLVRADVEKFIPILDSVSRLTSGRRIYDVNCGIGGLVWLAKLRGWTYCGGNDINPYAVQAAKDLFGITLACGEFDESRVIGQSLDVVVFHHGIEHCKSPFKAVEAVRSHMPRGSIIYFSHPLIPTEAHLEQLGCNAHSFEWTKESFRNFLGYLNIPKIQ